MKSNPVALVAAAATLVIGAAFYAKPSSSRVTTLTSAAPPPGPSAPAAPPVKAGTGIESGTAAEPTTPDPPAPPAYEFVPPSPDGIGKMFHGREIARVMGHVGLDWLERTSRELEEAPSRAIDAIEIRPDATIADLGAGSGYYSFRLAKLVPDGKVMAVDIQPEMLDFLKQRAATSGVTNIEPHLGEISDVGLPDESIDAALLVDAYHEFSHPAEMLASLHSALRRGGRIYLLEYRGEDDAVPIKPLHKMTAAQAREEFEGAGFRFVENRDFLPWQHFLVFERP